MDFDKKLHVIKFKKVPFESIKNMKLQQYLFAQRYAAKCLQRIKKYFTLISNLDGYRKEARKQTLTSFNLLHINLINFCQNLCIF